MDSDRPTTVALTVSAAGWRGAIAGLDQPGALEAFAERLVRAACESASRTAWLKAGEVSVLLTDDREIRSLNLEYRSRDYATNVLSFPGIDLVDGETDEAQPPGPVALGDIVMSVERLIAEADEQGKSRRDHVAHLLVHGTLHLLGYDHEDDGRAETMEALEESTLRALGFADPYEPVLDGPASETAAMSAMS